jgi:hypothetical protein
VFKDGDEMVFFSNNSLPAGIAYAIPPLPPLPAKVFTLSFCNVPFPKDDFTALLPHCSRPAGNSKITHRLPYIYVEKISGVSLRHAAPAFLQKEMANEEVFKDGDEMVFFSKYFQAEGIADAIPILSYLSAKIFIHTFCNAPFPKDDFTALLPHCSVPARNTKIIPRLPFISAAKIKCLFLIAAAPAFLRREKLMSECPKMETRRGFSPNISKPKELLNLPPAFLLSPPKKSSIFFL